MSAAVHVVETPIGWLARYLGDPTYKWLSEVQYAELILEGMKAAASTEATYTFYKRGTGMFICPSLGLESSVVLWFKTSAAPFTGEDNCTYNTYCTGGVYVSAGSPTATEIAIIGTTVHLPLVVTQACFQLATLATTKIDQEGLAVSELQSRWLRIAEYWGSAQ